MINSSILFLNGADYTLGWGRSVNLAKAFAAKGCDVFYSEYPKPLYKKRDRLLDGKRFPVLCPSGLPAVRYPFLRGLNKWYLLSQLTRAIDSKRLHPDIMWVCTVTDPQIVEYLQRRYAPRFTVYDCADDRMAHAAHTVSTGYIKKMETMEAELLTKVDVVFVVSSKLSERISSMHRNVFLVPNGVDLGLFNINSVSVMPPDIRCLGRPIIGFVGTLGHWIDMELVIWLAQTRPKWSFVFVGPYEANSIDRLNFPDNIYLLGKKPYTDIPSYLANFDQCIVPFKDCRVAEASDSLKILQYLAMGRPITSTMYNGVKDYNGLVKIAKTRHDFLAAIEFYLSEDSAEIVAKRVHVAKEHSWYEKASTILDIMSTCEPRASMKSL